MNNSKMTTNHTNSKLESLVRFFKSIFHKKRLIVFIGTKGTTLTAYRLKKTKETLYIPHKDKLRVAKYRRFFQQYKRHNISFLLDNSECSLKHKIMPILRPMVNINPIEHFISENYDASDIVSYYTYEVENKENEIWNNCIVSTPFISPISNMIQHVISNSFKYSGAYFLPLEFHNIINKILLENKLQKYKNDLQIFATITKSSDIRIVVKHKQNILDQYRIECPADNKSILLGTIEHSITEKLLFYKEYIKTQNLKTCIILLLGGELKKPAKNLNFNCDKLVVVNGEDEFQDHILMDKFDESNAHIAFNQPLRSITKLTLFSKIIFKPLILIAVSLGVATVILKSQSLITQSETNILNKKYYTLSEKYREVQHHYPKNININDLVDLYNLEKIVGKTKADFAKPISAILSFNNPELKIVNINLYNKTTENSDSQIAIDLIHISDKKSAAQSAESINGYVNYLKSIFQNYDIIYQEDQKNITNIAGIITIPARILIRKPEEGESYAR